MQTIKEDATILHIERDRMPEELSLNGKPSGGRTEFELKRIEHAHELVLIESVQSHALHQMGIPSM